MIKTKNKMNKKFIILVCIIILLFSSQNAMALKAIFPDSSKLQPAPAGIHANISGNINSHVDAVSSAQDLSDFNPLKIGDTSNKNIANNSSSLKNNTHQYNFLWLIILFIIIIFIIVFKYFKIIF